MHNSQIIYFIPRNIPNIHEDILLSLRNVINADGAIYHSTLPIFKPTNDLTFRSRPVIPFGWAPVVRNTGTRG